MTGPCRWLRRRFSRWIAEHFDSAPSTAERWAGRDGDKPAGPR